MTCSIIDNESVAAAEIVRTALSQEDTCSLRTPYGVAKVRIHALDKISMLQAAATIEFLSNNLPSDTRLSFHL